MFAILDSLAGRSKGGWVCWACREREATGQGSGGGGGRGSVQVMLMAEGSCFILAEGRRLNWSLSV